MFSLLVARLLAVAACVAIAWLQLRARTGIGVGIALCGGLLAMRMLGEEPSELIAWMALVPLFSLGAWGHLWEDTRYRKLAAPFVFGIPVFCLGCMGFGVMTVGTEMVRGAQLEGAFVSIVPASWAVLACGLGAVSTMLPLLLPRPPAPD